MQKTTQKIDLSHYPIKLKFNIDNSWSNITIAFFFDALNSLYQINILNMGLDDLFNDENIKEYEKKFILKRDSKWTKITGITNRYNYANIITKSYIIIDDKLFKENDIINLYTSTLDYKKTISLFLQVKKISFGSPGVDEILGIAQGLIAILDFLNISCPNLNIISNDYYSISKELKNQKLDLENQILNEQIKSKKIDNYKKMGLSESEIRKLILIEDDSVKIINELVKNGCIENVKIEQNN